ENYHQLLVRMNHLLIGIQTILYLVVGKLFKRCLGFLTDYYRSYRNYMVLRTGSTSSWIKVIPLPSSPSTTQRVCEQLCWLPKHRAPVEVRIVQLFLCCSITNRCALRQPFTPTGAPRHPLPSPKP